MRISATIVGLGILVLTGCGMFRPGGAGKVTDTTPLPKDAPSATALVNYLNDNGNRIQTVSVDMMELDCYQGGKSFGLRGKMRVEKQRNFRLTAGAVAGQELDLGSNDKEFWFWVKRGEPPHQFYCSYNDLTEGKVKAMPLPFQPEWIMETFGLGPYGPAEKYTLDTSDRSTVKLIEKTVSPQGKAVRKVIVFNRRPVPAPQPQVQQYQLVDDATGKEICSAHITEVQIDKKSGAIVPRKVELRYAEQNVTLKLRLDETAINGAIPATAFARPSMTGIQAINLAAIHLDPTAIRPVDKR